MIAAPSRSSFLGCGDGLGLQKALVSRSPIVRRLAVSASAGNASDESSGNSQLSKQQSNMPASQRPSRGMTRGGRANPLFLDVWDPLLPSISLGQMLATVDRLFDDAFFPFQYPSQAPASTQRTPWDIMETEDAFKLRLDMPGLSKEEVKVTVEDGDLVIKGEHKKEGEENNWKSRSSRVYSTRMTLPDNVKIEEVKAEVKNGVLEVVLPKSKEEPKKNIIDINVN